MKPLIQSIVVAVSGSDASVQAAKYGILLSKVYQCAMTAVFVVDTATLHQLVSTKIFLKEEGREYEESLYTNGRRYLNYIQELALQKRVHVETALRSGAIYDEVLKETELRKADLLLLGVSQLDSDEQAAITESYREMLFQANCSVLVVKGKNIDELFKTA